MTRSEAFVAELCQKSFLPFWSFANPVRKKNKELCDVLIVCGNDIIIISIKDIKISDHADQMVQYGRWQKKAIADSISQIQGAERFLNGMDEITLSDLVTKIQLPAKQSRNIYRIAIAFGGDNKFPLETGQFKEGFVHVFDEESTFTVFDELDTVSDFINYLKAKQRFLSNKTIFVPREVDFLALYINTSLEFDFNPNLVSLDDGLWTNYITSLEYKKWKKDIQISYAWDHLVEQLFKIHVDGNPSGKLRPELEKATRTIALEPRMHRIELGMILNDAVRNGVNARMLKALPGSDHSYVIMPLSAKNWEQKEKELQLRCLVARYENINTPKVIGIAIGREPGKEPIFDIVYFDLPQLSDEMIEKIKSVKQELGYFKKPVVTHSKDMRHKY